MNIFFTSFDPIDAAASLDDKRAVKMVLETTQMLSTAISFYGGAQIYKPVHVNHPCSKWVRATRGNYLWAYDLMVAQIDEYYLRYGRDHACALWADTVLANRGLIPDGDFTEPPKCMPDEFKRYPIVEAYRRYLCYKWANDIRPPRWTHRVAPGWGVTA